MSTEALLYAVATIIDAPCGDLHWMTSLDYKFQSYIGLDVVPELIEKLQAQNTDPERTFAVKDITADPLPSGDLMFCRDCLVHLPLPAGLAAIQNIKKSGITYLAVTTFPGRENRDCKLGNWRALDMEAAPFNFPAPMHMIREREPNPNDRNNEKSIGVWRVSDLP